MNQVTVDEIIRGIVAYEQKNWFADYLYLKAIAESDCVRRDLNKITKEYLEQIVKPYLVSWGQMGRVVGGNRIEWNRVAALLSEKQSSVGALADCGILDSGFKESAVRENIISLYSGLTELRFPYTNRKRKRDDARIGPTSVSKILHLLNPRLFVMWDSKVRGNREAGGQSYLEFLVEQQDVAKALATAGASDSAVVELLCSKLASCLPPLQAYKDTILSACKKKTLAKLIDEYNISR